MGRPACICGEEDRACLYADAVLISNDHHFDKIKEEGIIQVWSSSKTIRRLLHGIEDFEDSG